MKNMYAVICELDSTDPILQRLEEAIQKHPDTWHKIAGIYLMKVSQANSEKEAHAIFARDIGELPEWKPVLFLGLGKTDNFMKQFPPGNKHFQWLSDCLAFEQQQ